MSNSNPATSTSIGAINTNNSNPSINTTTNATTTGAHNQQQQHQQDQPQQQQPPMQAGSNSNIIELDTQFILRMPTIKSDKSGGAARPHPATLALREALADQLKITDEQNDPLRGRLFIEINPETRKGRVKFDEHIFDARLVDLPCIIESLKTKDKRMFYKAADISQMLVCKTEEEKWSDEDENGASTAIKKKDANKALSQAELFNKKYQWPHGITPPLKNVRRKRFRKTAKKKVVDYAEIEKEVKQLFRGDREAVSVSYEVVYMEGEEPMEGSQTGGDQEGQEGERKSLAGTSKYDWEEDSMMSPDENSSSFMMRRPVKIKSMAGGSSLASGAASGANAETAGEAAARKEAGGGEDSSNLYESKSQKQDNTVTSGGNDDEASNLEAATNFKSLFVKEVIGDLSSSDDDDDDELGDDDEANEQNQSDNNDESNSNMESVASKSKSNYETGAGAAAMEETMDDNDEDEDDDEDDDDLSEENDDDENSQLNNTTSELNTKLNKLLDELNRIQEERRRREIEINPITNPVLKAHLSSRLNNLIDEENKKKNEIEEIKSMLDQ